MRKRLGLVAAGALFGYLLSRAFSPAFAPRAPKGPIDDFAVLLRKSANAGIGLELVPGADVVFHGAPIKTNAAGYRGKDWSAAKPGGTLRIAGVGDSVMMGWDVPQERTYMDLLATELTSRVKRPVETLNFAVAGYNTSQEYYVLKERALAYSPDLVVLGYVGNDFEPASVPTPPEVNGEPSPRGFEEALERIAKLCSERKIPLVVLLDSRYQSPLMRHREVARRAKALGAQVVDLRALYRKLPESWNVEQETSAADEHNKLYVPEPRGHPNAAWHARTASVLADFVVERDLLKLKAE